MSSPAQHPPSVWITRAEPGASATAARVTALGLAPLIAPLLSFHPLPADLSLGVDEVLAFTSLNGVERTAALTARRDMPVFAVGDATAEGARAAGFTGVVSAAGDVEALAALILAARPAGGVAHPAAEETAGDLVGRLNAEGLPARKLAIYRTQTVAKAPLAVVAALQAGALAAVLIHSPKAGRAAAGLLADWRDRLGGTAALGLSPACVAPLQDLGFAAVAAAAAPTEDALMQMLGARA